MTSDGTSSHSAAHRLSELDGLRAISILLVMAAHMLPLGPKAWQLNGMSGAMGMSLFFGLSGFLICSTLLQRPDVKDFLVRRFSRILPLYLIYVFIVFALWDHSIARLLNSAAFVINYRSEYLDVYTAHLWSLCVEMHFYVTIALLVALLGRRAVWLVWPACVAVTLLRIGSGEIVSNQTHFRVDEILAGGAVATLYVIYGRAWRDSAALRWVALAGLCVWIGGSHVFGGNLGYLRPYGSAAVIAGAIWVAPALVRSFLASSPMRYIAEISYALYVIHPATIAGWMNEGSSATRYLMKRPVSFLLTFGLAHLSTFYWEAIFRRRASAYLAERKTSVPVPRQPAE